MSPWIGIALTLGALGGLMAGLRAARARTGMHPELCRKLLHIGMGLTTLSFPWLFHAAWPVVLLAAVSMGLLIGLRRSEALRERFGGVVDGVERKSLGEVFFPPAVAAVFVLSRGDPVLYGIPVLLLTLGDAAAALVGVRYGTVRYTTSEGHKSAEGSVAFFLAAFLSVHVPLLLFTTTGRTESLFIGLTLGLLATLMEAAAWSGLDNLFLPLGGFVLLRVFVGLNSAELAARLGVAAGLLLLALAWRRRTTLNDSAMMGAALAGYVAWAVGGPKWLVAPATLLCGYTLLWPLTKGDAEADGTRPHGIGEVVDSTGVGMGWLFLAGALGRPDLLFPYTLSFAGHLAIIGGIRLRSRLPGTVAPVMILSAVAKSAVLFILPCLLLEGRGQRPLIAAVAGPAGIALTVGIAWLSEHLPAASPPAARKWLRQAGIAVGSAAGLIPLTGRGPWSI